MAVESWLNIEKREQGPDDWLPPDPFFQCIYVERFNDVVDKYGLIYSKQEKCLLNESLLNVVLKAEDVGYIDRLVPNTIRWLEGIILYSVLMK
ncbi:MAG: hypothetical protein Q9M91_06860 [Candidatus Dojkabacteria bacterium]|nr:hypothetical protein [Candidatus Dojkabacteria bacterium]